MRDGLICGAQTRRGGICQARPMANGRCKVHGGMSLSGSDHPNFKHGLYSKYAPAQIQEKIDDYIQADPLSLTHELALTRALLGEWLSHYKDGTKLDFLGVGVLSDLIANVRRTVESISKIKNETALTAAEVAYLQVRVVDVAIKYFPNDPAKQEQFITDLFAVDSGLIDQYTEFIEGQAAVTLTSG